jgi:hypothetical protein
MERQLRKQEWRKEKATRERIALQQHYVRNS